MKETIELDFPFSINGEDITVIEYDTSDFKTKHYLQAAGARKYTSGTVNPVSDTELHFNIAVQAILSSNKNKGWTVEDFGRLTGSDPFKFQMAGLGFFTATPEAQANDNSEEPFEDTASDSTLPGTHS